MKNIYLELSNQHLLGNKFECQHCYEENIKPENAYTDCLLPLDENEEFNSDNAYVLCCSCLGDVVCHTSSPSSEWKRISDLKLTLSYARI